MLYPGRIIKAGEQDAEIVKALKTQLNEALGTADNPALRLDPGEPHFGPRMEQAVKLFQARHLDVDGRSLRQDGEVGSLTCTFGWLATALAYCCGAGGKVSARGLVIGITAAVVSGALLVIAAVGFGQYEWLALAGWIFVGVLLWSVRSRV